MILLRLVGCVFSFAATVVAAADAPPASGASLVEALHHVSLDETKTFRIRDLALARGDIKIYLNEGVLSFFQPVNHRVLGAIFTAEGVEAGDAEIILLPPQRSERASLASFTKTPNIDEHFATALFFFTDSTAQELLAAINRAPIQEAPELAASLGPRVDPVAGELATQLQVPLIQALLDNHPAAQGFFFAVVAGRNLGTFDVSYDPTQPEPLSAGRASETDKRFQLWTNFRPRRAAPFVPPEARIRDYRVESTIAPDLTMQVATSFRIKSAADDGRVLALDLSPRLKISSATIDGHAAEILQRPSKRLVEFGGAEAFLLISERRLDDDVEHEVKIRYGGSIIRRTPTGEYFVDDRSSWYPTDGVVQANFDLTFHYPQSLHLVSTGEFVNESTSDNVRTVHRRTLRPAALAGFNLGNYDIRRETHGPYAIEVDSPNVSTAASLADPRLISQAEKILDDYTARWMPLPIRSLAISPIAGNFGQGFPGLIYLSSVSYIRQDRRSPAFRNARSDAFFSELLLPHELAHQWWGNIVGQADYRSAWITEAMANDSALEHIERVSGATARDEILASYRQDLTEEHDGRTAESAGPVDFGERLIDTHGLSTWNIVLYEKGSWILHMLRRRLGEAGYRGMQLQLLREYSGKPLSNEAFRQAASKFVPAGQPDPTLSNFFETWVYGNGIPALDLRRANKTLEIEVSGVDDDFMSDVPLRCRGGTQQWVRLITGTNRVELPRGVSSCELPSQRDFLYVLPTGR